MIMGWMRMSIILTAIFRNKCKRRRKRNPGEGIMEEEAAGASFVKVTGLPDSSIERE